MLQTWKLLSKDNDVFEKDYFIINDYVLMTIAISVEKPFLFKTFTAKCHLDESEIGLAINKLDEKKDELI